MTTFALCAANHVGTEIARFLGAQSDLLACVIVNRADSEAVREQIISAANATHVIHSDALYEPGTIKLLQSLSIDYLILAWWPNIIKSALINIPARGCLNFHPSYLPYNRGKHYNFWNLVEDVPFGVTIHWVDESVDGGEIAFQRKIEKTWEDTGASLFSKAQHAIIELFKDNFERIRLQDVPRIPQQPDTGSYHHSRELDAASRIDLNATYTARHLLNVLRARTFPPHPGAWFVADGVKYEVRVDIRKVNENE